MTMTAGQKAQLRNLCDIFKIPHSSTEPNPELCWFILSNM